MRPTFLEPSLQADLDRDGYAVVDMLDDAEVAQLRGEYERLGAAPGDPHLACHSSFHSYDRSYKLEVDRVVRGALDPHLERLFDRQRALPCNFIAKWPAPTSGFGLHQDLSLVDESQHRSVEVWVSLDDTNAQNGQLWMVPGSHQWLPIVRGIHAFDFPFAATRERIMQQHSRPVPVKAGQAIVFNHATIHFSFPNRSDAARLVAITDLIPEEAAHLHYFGDRNGSIDVYEIDESFWTSNNPFTLHEAPADAAHIDRIAHEQHHFDDAMLDELVANGLAIQSDEAARGGINAARAWCHRCGSTGFESYEPNRFLGNVTMLCPDCVERESVLATTG